MNKNTGSVCPQHPLDAASAAHNERFGRLSNLGLCLLNYINFFQIFCSILLCLIAGAYGAVRVGYDFFHHPYGHYKGHQGKLRYFSPLYCYLMFFSFSGLYDYGFSHGYIDPFLHYNQYPHFTPHGLSWPHFSFY